MTLLALDIDQEMLERRADLAGATDQQLRAAITSALRKMETRVETRIKRRAAKTLRIPQRSLENRFFSKSIQPGDSELKVWIGTWHLSPFAIGSPRTYGTPCRSGGVKVGGRTYPGAFLAKIYTVEEKVWIRLSSKHYSPELYPTKYRPGDRGLGGDKSRFPVVRAAVPIDDVMRDVIEQEGPQILQEFDKVFLAELNYQVNVKGKRA